MSNHIVYAKQCIFIVHIDRNNYRFKETRYRVRETIEMIGNNLRFVRSLSRTVRDSNTLFFSTEQETVCAVHIDKYFSIPTTVQYINVSSEDLIPYHIETAL